MCSFDRAGDIFDIADTDKSAVRCFFSIFWKESPGVSVCNGQTESGHLKFSNKGRLQDGGLTITCNKSWTCRSSISSKLWHEWNKFSQLPLMGNDQLQGGNRKSVRVTPSRRSSFS